MSYSADDIAYERTGSGPPMILVHGCPATHTLWAPVVPELARHRTLFAIDLPGFGGSPAPRDRAELELPRLAAIVARFAERQGLARYDVVGHSFGSAIAAVLATEAPDRVASLVMLAPMSYETPPGARLGRSWLARSIAAPAWRRTPRSVRRAIVRFGTRLNYGPAYIGERGVQVAMELDTPQAVESIHRLCAACDYAEYRARLERLERELDVPTLIVGAARDRIVPYRHFQHLRELLRRAEHEAFVDGVHVLMWQHPKTIAETVIRFVERADSA